MQTLDYGNGDSVEYTYDNKGRVTSQTYEDGDTVTYTYDNNSALAKMTDSATGITTTYYYDSTERMMKYVESGSGYSHSVGYAYDSLNNLTRLVETVDGVERTTDYTYDDDNRVESVSTDGVSHHYTYDSFGRVSEQTTKHNGTDVLTKTMTFQSSASGKTSGQVATYTIDAGNYDVTYTYTYDDNGNILTISDGTNTTSYVYDSQNQLLRENNQAVGFTHVWEYDNAGNILSRTEYAYTTGELGTPTDPVTYAYGVTEWGDLLTSYNGNAITYDEIGNPLTYGSRTYTWEHGRELASLQEYGTTWNFTYNADGLRTKRTDGTNTYSYVYYDGHLQYMGYNGTKVYFTHAPDGTPMGMLTNGTAYFYVTNLQGDVVAITDDEGNIVVEYTYDAWGNILSTTGSLASTIGELNPFRYRGYVYDRETELYYLQSRYYDPEIGRFINADRYASMGQSILGSNMFAYCGNDPIHNCDSRGDLFEKNAGGGGGFGGAIFGGSADASRGYSGYVPTRTTIVNNLLVATAVVSTTIAINELRAEAMSIRREQARVKAQEQSIAISKTEKKPTYIYRYGGTNPGNLTPKAKDKNSGLSFSTVPMPGAAITTIEAIDSTGVVYAIRDGITHVSVRPVGATMDDWINAGASSIWTQAVRSVVVKWDGGY